MDQITPLKRQIAAAYCLESRLLAEYERTVGNAKGLADCNRARVLRARLNKITKIYLRLQIRLNAIQTA